MASAEDVGEKKQMFYEIECVIDDCEADVEIKPLSDSDEFDEEEEPREEDIDSSEEWEPLMQSKLKRNASPSSSSLPRRRGRPRKNVSSETAAPVKQILPKITPAPTGMKRRRGRPPKDQSKIKLLPKPTLYPMIVPKPPVFATLIPNTSAQNLKIGPNSTSTITLGPNFSPLTLSSPASSVNPNPNSAPILIPNSTSAFNLSPNSATSASNSSSIATLFCTTTSTKIMVDGDSRESKTEEQTSVNETEEESPAPKDENPEFSESPNAKRQRLSLAFLPSANAQQIDGPLNHSPQPVSDNAPASESSPELSLQPSPTTMDDQLTSIFGSDLKPEANCDLDGDTDGISDSDREDELWEDDFYSGEDWNLLLDCLKSPASAQSPRGGNPPTPTSSQGKLSISTSESPHEATPTPTSKVCVIQPTSKAIPTSKTTTIQPTSEANSIFQLTPESTAIQPTPESTSIPTSESTPFQTTPESTPIPTSKATPTQPTPEATTIHNDTPQTTLIPSSVPTLQRRRGRPRKSSLPSNPKPISEPASNTIPLSKLTPNPTFLTKLELGSELTSSSRTISQTASNSEATPIQPISECTPSVMQNSTSKAPLMLSSVPTLTKRRGRPSKSSLLSNSKPMPQPTPTTIPYSKLTADITPITISKFSSDPAVKSYLELVPIPSFFTKLEPASEPTSSPGAIPQPTSNPEATSSQPTPESTPISSSEATPNQPTPEATPSIIYNSTPQTTLIPSPDFIPKATSIAIFCSNLTSPFSPMTMSNFSSDPTLKSHLELAPNPTLFTKLEPGSEPTFSSRAIPQPSSTSKATPTQITLEVAPSIIHNSTPQTTFIPSPVPTLPRRRGRPRKSSLPSNAKPIPEPTPTTIPCSKLTADISPITISKFSSDPAVKSYLELAPNPTFFTKLEPGSEPTSSPGAIPQPTSNSEDTPTKPTHESTLIPTSEATPSQPSPESTPISASEAKPSEPTPEATLSIIHNSTPQTALIPSPDFIPKPTPIAIFCSNITSPFSPITMSTFSSDPTLKSHLELAPNPTLFTKLEPGSEPAFSSRAIPHPSSTSKATPTQITLEVAPSVIHNSTPQTTFIPSPVPTLPRQRGRPRKSSLPSNPKPVPESTPITIPCSKITADFNPTTISNFSSDPTLKSYLELAPNPTLFTKLEPGSEPTSSSEATPQPTSADEKPITSYSLRHTRTKESVTSDSPWPEVGSKPDKWLDLRTKDEEPVLHRFSPKRPPGPQFMNDLMFTPLKLFQLFFTISAIKTIIRNTNSKAERRAKVGKFRWVPLTVAEFYSYLALVIYMGLVKTKSIVDYWAKKQMYNFSYPQSIMSQERFQAISWNLNLCDLDKDEENSKKKGTPGYDRLFKIKPLYCDLLSACKKHFHPNREILVDERMVTARDRIELERCKNRPTTLGYRLFVLNDLSSGYTWNFFVYDGKSSASSGKGLGYDSVMRLLDGNVLGKGYRLYADNFFTSPTLFSDLLQNSIFACGTLHHNSNLPTVNDLSERSERGSIRWCRQGPLLFVKWMDAKEVLMCSTIHKAFTDDTVSRNTEGEDGVWKTCAIPVPSAVKDYSKYMDAVDLSDSLIEHYNVLKTTKWYNMIFYHFLDIAVVNSFVLHQQLAKTQKKTPLTHKMFRETLVSELVSAERDRNPVFKDPLISASKKSTDNSAHMPSSPNAYSPSDTELSPPDLFSRTKDCYPEYYGADARTGRKLCVMCKLVGNKIKTPIFCSYCKVALCFVPSRNCFKKWHKGAIP